jgi:dual specificity tyrosine-phosphorylation-regulated kinase 1
MAEQPDEDNNIRECGSRPIYKLTVTLIQTYKTINKLYYHDKTRQRCESVAHKKFDDEFDNYIIQPGEEIIGRYVVQERIGKGSFGQVVRAFDTVTSTDVALKMIKSKKLFKNQAITEIDILMQLRDQDPEDQHHIIRMLNHFEHRNHPCIVFELLSNNLYDLLRNTKFRGISLDLVHKFAKQILEALVFMRKQSIIHCDLKVLHLPSSYNILRFLCIFLQYRARKYIAMPA